MERGKSRRSKTRKKKVHWESTFGRIEVAVQRFWDGKKLEVPFTTSANIRSRDYSLLLERVITDFGADISFGQAIEKIREHYGINVSLSAVQTITKKHAKGCFEMIEKDIEISRDKEATCVIGEIDGSMIPIVFFEKDANSDKRKSRKVCWKEARLSVAKEKGSITKVFLATLGSTERAGELLRRCVNKIGRGNQTKIHCLGDGATWIYEQVERVFGLQANYLIDFFHLSEYLAYAAENCCHDNSKEWLKEQQEKLKKNKLEEVLATLKNNIESEEVPDKNAPVRRCCRYIENRPGQFKYQEAIKNELPIGSGEIESGNKSIVQKRLKIPGAWWKIDTAEYMLALRCVRNNGDWMKYWKQINILFANAA
jgi:Uncharacterised protein family (UPF0236)